MPSRFYIHYVSKFGRPSSFHRIGQCPRRVVPKNMLTTGQLHLSPMLVRSCLKSCMLGFSTVWTKNFQMSKLSLERGTGNQIANFSRIIEKAREFQKNIYLCFIDYAKAFVWIITNCGKLLKRWEYQIILPVSWETHMWIKKQQLEPCIDWFKIEKGVRQGCLLSPCLFNLYTEHIMRNARLNELQAGIKIARRNINNLIYEDDPL